jgi:hypothetical protein
VWIQPWTHCITALTGFCCFPPGLWRITIVVPEGDKGGFLICHSTILITVWMVFQQLLFHWPILKNYLPVWTSYMLEWFYSCSTFMFCLPLKVECNHMRYSYETAVLTWIWIFYGLWYPVVEFAHVVWMDQRYSNHESDICSLPWGHRNLCIWTMGISNVPGWVLT